MVPILSRGLVTNRQEEVRVISGIKMFYVVSDTVSTIVTSMSFVLTLQLTGWGISAAKSEPVADSIVAVRTVNENVDRMCLIFDDCTALKIPDSIAILGRTYLDTAKPSALRHANADVFAYIYFDNDLVVERVNIGSFLPEGVQSRDSVMESFLRMFRGFLEPSILGRTINPNALSFPGGRPGTTTCVDGFGDVDTSEVGGLSMWMPRSGCLILHFKFVRSGGCITLDRRAVISLRQGL